MRDFDLNEQPTCTCGAEAWVAFQLGWDNWTHERHLCCEVCRRWAVDIGRFPSRTFAISNDSALPYTRPNLLSSSFYNWVGRGFKPTWDYFDESLRRMRDPIVEAYKNDVRLKLGLQQDVTYEDLPHPDKARWNELMKELETMPDYMIPPGSHHIFIPPCVPAGVVVWIQTACAHDYNKSEWRQVDPAHTQRLAVVEAPRVMRQKLAMQDACAAVEVAIGQKVRLTLIEEDILGPHRGEYRYNVRLGLVPVRISPHHSYWAITTGLGSDAAAKRVSTAAFARNRTCRTRPCELAGTHIEVHADTFDEIAEYLTLIGQEDAPEPNSFVAA